MFVWVIRMLLFDRIDVLEGTGINKIDASKKCILCHYWCFTDIGYKFEPHVCNGCHDILMMGYKLKIRCNIECKKCWL